MAMDMGQRNCYRRGWGEQENKTLKTNGANKKKHAGREKSEGERDTG
jgi:hypothetical protein